MFSALLLGTPQLLLDGKPLAVPRRKSRAVVYFLAAETAPRTREAVIGLLWADHDRHSAQQVLRTTLHDLRKALGPALVLQEGTVALAPEVQVDVRAFEAALSTPPMDPARLQSALDLYRGDFLSGFDVPDAAEFEEWVGWERERYRRLAIRGLIALSQAWEAAQDFGGALDMLTRALSFDPLQEDLQRAALRLHYLAGDRAGAIRQYEALRKLLDDELGVPPMAETRRLYDAIIGDRAEVVLNQSAEGSARALAAQRSGAIVRSPVLLVDRPPVAIESLPFTGRAIELEALKSATTAHKLALIEGEPGIGKSRLAEQFIRESRALPLVGVARELEQGLPYQPIIEAVRSLMGHPDWPRLWAGLRLSEPWMTEIARLVPELALLSPAVRASDGGAPALAFEANESRLWEGVNQFLLALSRQRPVVLFLDDTHWADTSTLSLLGYLVRQAAIAPIAFVATARQVAPRSSLAVLVQTLTREGRLARLPLARLSAGDVTALAQHLSPAYAYPLAEWLSRASEGNPYILTELVSYARESGLLRPDGVVQLDALSASPIVPQTVYSLIESRLDRLSGAARRVVDVAVAAGREFEVEVVARAAGLSEGVVLDALDELRSAGLILPVDEHRYSFDHSLTMEVAYRAVGEFHHRLLHRRVAEAIEQVYRNRLEGVAGVIAWHFAEGNAPERATPYALQAGRMAAGLAAWTEAIRLYQLALAGASDDEQRMEILMALGDACAQAGEAAQSSEAFRAALDLAEARGDSDAAEIAQLGLGRSLLVQARFQEGIALAQQVVHSTRPERVVDAESLWGTILSVEGADLAAAAEHLERAAGLCAAQSDPVRLVQIRFDLGSVAAQQGDLERAIMLYRQSLEVAQQTPADAALQWQILAQNNLGYHLHLLGDPTAIDYARAGLALAEEKGVVSLQPYLLSTLGEIALAQGDVDEAEARFSQGLAIAERLSMPERIAGLTANLGLVARERGQSSLAIHRLSTALGRADAFGTQHLAAQIRLWLVPLLPPAEARTYLAEARSIAESGGRKRLLQEAAKLEAEIGC